MNDTNRLQFPEGDRYLVPGVRVKLGRFETTVWEVSYGWYSWGGNRPVCGWFLIDVCERCRIKPFQLTDFDDIYLIEV